MNREGSGPLDHSPAQSLRAIDQYRLVPACGKSVPPGSLSQALGRAVRGAGAEALLAPSAVVGGAFNLVVFVENLLPESAILIENQAELDRWLKKR